MSQFKKRATVGAVLTGYALLNLPSAMAVPLPGGTLDPLSIPKYVTPLVIPPVMNNTGVANDYDIAVRQFQQQILPGGIWATLPGCDGRGCTFPATTVFSYGPAADPTPALAPDPSSQFNYPAYTIETTANTDPNVDTSVTVDWINDLVVDPDACKASRKPKKDPACNFTPHITPVDRSLHWANPELLTCGDTGTVHTDCRPAGTNGALLQEPYLGPVPIITHVHGAHTNPNSDGYPEAWWLPAANDIPRGFAIQGKLANGYGQPDNTNVTLGVGNFSYRNDQPSTTLWYHDHTLGMTRNNVYAGPAGFWLIREAGGGETGLDSGVLPGPAPVAGQVVLDLNVPGNPVRNGIREIPIVIQDRSFNADGSLFYPADRAFFEGIPVADLLIPFIGDANDHSDISPIWNPEAFFNTMVVNGVTWPVLEVAPAIYRFRLLNGSNSRFLNLSLSRLNSSDNANKEIPFYQVGGDQSLLPQVVEIVTGKATPLVPGIATWDRVNAPSKDQTLLMGWAERADVLVDFRGLKDGTIVRMFNTAPDAPFGGFPDVPADPGTTGQVMQFVVNAALNGASTTDPVLADGVTPNLNAATDPWNLSLSLPDADDPANSPFPLPGARDLALLEEESFLICATIQPDGTITYDADSTPDLINPGTCIDNGSGMLAASVPFAPKAAVLGINGTTGGTATLWSDLIVTNPGLNSTETWELWNWSADAHPIHVHLVKYKVVNREAFDPLTGNLLGPRPAEATEAGWKDTVIAYPGEVTRFNATFDIEGLYVWHCHIVEHEDNEMMVPFCVGDSGANGCGVANQ